MEGYEKIRIVGKGAFGIAVLYKKKKSNQLVVIKEINTHDLTPTERQMALNEVEVLSSLHHPNIIAYGGSFEHQGVLMIEMEYADGGTLSQMLTAREKNLPERDILTMLHQISGAIVHMHASNILHRDLKTANVFMNSDGCIKIGDFGISKILTTNAQAQTVLGTPYYISPEMCEGKDYDEKSDIWAMGCILYEMCCLHRTFQASSLPALVNKIMKGDFKPIPSGYSTGLTNLVRELLAQNPEDRPSAIDVNEDRIPQILTVLGTNGYKYVENLSKVPNSKIVFLNGTSMKRSVLYQVKSFENNTDIKPIQLSPNACILHVGAGKNHFIVVTNDGLVFTWGEDLKGQLGHGGTQHWRHYPLLVDALVHKNVIMAEAGDSFTVLLTKEGKVLTCGDGSVGSLGHGDWNDCTYPKLIEALQQIFVTSISCGSNHIVAIAKDSQIYSWGCGYKGQTGIRSTANSCVPVKISTPFGLTVLSVHCGIEGTMAITSKGTILSCGWNKNNRLALMERADFTKRLRTPDFDIVTGLKEILGIPGHAVDCSIGLINAAVVVKLPSGSSAVYITGRPPESFVSLSDNTSTYFVPTRIRDLDGIEIMTVKCGPTYTVVGTDDNCILLWGTRYGLPENISSSKDSQNSSGVWSQHSSLAKQMESLNGSGTSVFTNNLMSTYLSETILKPITLLGLYSSAGQVQSGSVLILDGVYPLQHSILILVQTTVCLAKNNDNDKACGSTEIGENEYSLQEYDSMGPLPDWMKAEIAQSKYPWSEQQN